MGESRPRAVRVTPDQKPVDQARREFEQSLLRQGAVQFDMAVGDQLRRVTALPEVMADIRVSGEPETRRNIIGHGHSAQAKLDQTAAHRGLLSEQSSVRIASSTGFDFGDEHYRLDLVDAPDELRSAVLALWQKMESNTALYADHPEDMPAQLQAEYATLRERYGEIVRAISAVKAAETTIEEFPADSKVPYDQARMNRLPASDQQIFTSYRAKGWAKLGGKQRAHYRELKERLEAVPQANAAK